MSRGALAHSLPTLPDAAPDSETPTPRRVPPRPQAVRPVPRAADYDPPPPPEAVRPAAPRLFDLEARDADYHDRLFHACERRGYELLDPIGKGGMGCVWMAHHGDAGLVAIKAMLPRVADDPDFRAMFLDEGRIAARIDSPNVARVLALEEDGEVLFQVMEWVDGESLLDLHWAASRKGERIPTAVVLQILASACDGLYAAHQLRNAAGASLGVVHRDVSPANVLVASNGDVRLVDFGIAKARERTARSTMGFALKGRIHYVAPEYAHGFPIDQRADVWSMGATLYFLLCGREPFAAPNEAAVLFKLTSGAPPPSLPGYVPREVAAIAYRALQLDPAARYPDAAAMGEALRAAAERIDEESGRDAIARFFAEHESPATRERRRVALAVRGEATSPRVRALSPRVLFALGAALAAGAAWLALAASPAAAVAELRPTPTVKEARVAKTFVETSADVRIADLPPSPPLPRPRIAYVEPPPRPPAPEPKPAVVAPPPPPRPAPPPRRHYGF